MKPWLTTTMLLWTACVASEDEVGVGAAETYKPCVEDTCADQAMAQLLQGGHCEGSTEQGPCDVIDALGAPASGRGARVRQAHQVVLRDGTVLQTRAERLLQCGASPESCFVNLYTETTFEGVTTAKVLDLLYGDWRIFWRNSAITGEVTTRADLDTTATPYRPIDFVFHPLGSLRKQVEIRMVLGEPEANAADPLPWLHGGAVRDRWDVRVPIEMKGPAFTGNMSILLAQDAGGRVLFREVWNGMSITGALSRLPHVAAILHEWAGASRMPPAIVGGDSFGMDGATGWVGLADALEAGRRPPPGQRPYDGRLFETPGDLHRVEWRRRDDGRTVCSPLSDGCAWTIEGSSTISVDVAPDQVVRALTGSLGCVWRRGEVHGFTRLEHSRTYELVPLVLPGTSYVPARVNEELFDPRPIAGGGTRIDIQLKGPSFEGPAHFEVWPAPNGSRVVARFDAVRPMGIYEGLRPVLGDVTGLASASPRLGMRTHVLVQEGRMPLALGGVTGLVGLLDLLERGEPANGDPACLEGLSRP